MRIFIFCFILGQAFHANAKFEAGVILECTSCQSESPIQSIKELTQLSEPSTSNADCDRRAEILKQNWFEATCPDGIQESVDGRFLNQCVKVESDKDLSVPLLAIFAMNMLDREHQLMSQHSPSHAVDDQAFKSFLAKWRRRINHVPGKYFKNMLNISLDAMAELWEKQKIEEQLLGQKLQLKPNFDHRVAITYTSYLISKSVGSPEYLKMQMANGMSESDAKGLQYEELELIHYLQPEVQLLQEEYSVFDTFKASRIKEIQSDLLKVTEGSRFERIEQRAERIFQQVYKSVNDEGGMAIRLARNKMNEHHQAVLNSLDSAWNSALSRPSSLAKQPELLAQLTLLRDLGQEHVAASRSFKAMCAAKAEFESSLTKKERVEFWSGVAGGGAMALSFLVGRGAWATGKVSKNINILEGARKAEVLAGRLGMVGVGWFSFYSIGNIVSAHREYKKELVHYWLSNSRQSALPSVDSARVQSAQEKRDHAVKELVITGASLVPIALSVRAMSLATKAKELGNLSQAGGQAFKAKAFDYADRAVDLGFIGYSVAEGYQGGALLQSMFFLSRFGKMPSQRILETGKSP